MRAQPSSEHPPMLPQPGIELCTQLFQRARCRRRRGRHRGDRVGIDQVVGKPSCDGYQIPLHRRRPCSGTCRREVRKHACIDFLGRESAGIEFGTESAGHEPESIQSTLSIALRGKSVQKGAAMRRPPGGIHRRRCRRGRYTARHGSFLSFENERNVRQNAYNLDSMIMPTNFATCSG